MNLKPDRETLLQFAKFLLVGVANTAVGFGTIQLFMHVLGVHYVIADVAGYAVGITCSFFLNKFFTFRSRLFHADEIVKFLVVFGICFLLQLGIVALAVEVFKIDKTIATLIGMAVYTGFNFALNKLVTFRKRRDAASA